MKMVKKIRFTRTASLIAIAGVLLAASIDLMARLQLTAHVPLVPIGGDK